MVKIASKFVAFLGIMITDNETNAKINFLAPLGKCLVQADPVNFVIFK